MHKWYGNGGRLHSCGDVLEQVQGHGGEKVLSYCWWLARASSHRMETPSNGQRWFSTTIASHATCTMLENAQSISARLKNGPHFSHPRFLFEIYDTLSYKQTLDEELGVLHEKKIESCKENVKIAQQKKRASVHVCIVHMDIFSQAMDTANITKIIVSLLSRTSNRNANDQIRAILSGRHDSLFDMSRSTSFVNAWWAS